MVKYKTHQLHIASTLRQPLMLWFSAAMCDNVYVTFGTDSV